MTNIFISFIGIIGVIVGVILNELLRKKRRIESYTSNIFDKRLEKYEKLLNLIQDAHSVALDVMHNKKYSAEKRHDMISSVILPIAEFTDINTLYIDEEIAVHCAATFMGAEDV